MAGWNGSQNGGERPIAPQAKPAAKKPSVMRGIVAGLVVVGCLVVLVVVLIGGRGAGKDDEDRGKSKIVVVQSEKLSRPSSESTKTESAGKSKSTKAKPMRKVIVPDASFAEDEVPDESSTNAPSKSAAFKHGSDKILAMYMSVPRGGQLPPMPRIGQGETKRFIESLKEPIEISENDTERVKKLKEVVQAAREDMAQTLADNPTMSFADVLDEYRKTHNENLSIRTQTERELLEIIASGDEAGALKFRSTMNIALQQMGIDELHTPITENEREVAAEAEADEDEPSAVPASGPSSAK